MPAEQYHMHCYIPVKPKDWEPGSERLVADILGWSDITLASREQLLVLIDTKYRGVNLKYRCHKEAADMSEKMIRAYDWIKTADGLIGPKRYG